jgi:uncharacterized protein (TIGR00255 family)
MTGHGEARCLQDGVAVSVEIRAVNNRYLKVLLRTGEAQNTLEPQIEVLIREHIRRGTVTVNVLVEREASPDDFKLNEVVLASYREQLARLATQAGMPEAVRLDALLGLPGVVIERRGRNLNAAADWPLIEKTLLAALHNLARMRTEEGAAMAADLRANCQAIAADLQQIEQRAPVVVEGYRSRLLERLNKLLEDQGVRLEAADVLREVAMLAERSDIAEEVVRLRSHLDQFETIAAEKESTGRKLEFVIQEMFRETNTIGSKANDAEIARHVIGIKAAIERLREMIQNVE